jgi:hypothetical protein
MFEARKRARIRLVTFFLLTVALGMILVSQPGKVASGPASSAAGSATSPRLAKAVTPASGTPTGSYFDHVVVIVMENEGVYDICNSSPPPCLGNRTGAPFMGGLANNYTISSHYLSLITTSQPNYVALISGSMQGCTASGCPTPITAPNLVDRIEAASLTWKGYFENQTLAKGCDYNSPEPYAPIHNPFIVFQDITNNTARCNKLVRVNPNSCGSVTDCVLVNDLNNATAAAPNFMWLTPNDCDNMRGNAVCNTGSLIGPGDNFLSRLVPTILKSRTFTTSRSALFITFDEGNKFCPLNGSITEDCIYASWTGPVAKTSFGTTNLYSHYSFTKTIEVNWNFPSLAINDTNANPMTEFFKNVPPDFTVLANPSSVSAPVGSNSNSTITVASINNFAGTITLTASSSPTGPSLTLKPTSITLTAQTSSTSVLTFSTSTTGNYTVTVTGMNGTLSHNTVLTFSVGPPNFAISATPGSLIIGQPSFVAGSPVLANSTGDRTVFESSYLADSFYAKGLIWLFYEDSRYTCEHQTGCLTYTTSTNGSRWGPSTRVPVHITDNDFSVSTNGTSVFYVRYNETSFESSCGRNIQLGLGTLNISGNITWQPEQTVAVGSSTRTYPNDEIIVDSNGQLWIAYMIDNHGACGGDGTDRPEVIHSAGTNYATWTGNTTLSTAHSNNWHIALVSLGNGQVYASYWLRNTDLHGRLFNGAAWGSDEQISPTTTKNDGNAWLFNSGTNAYAIYFDNTTETFNLASRSTTGSWTINTIGTGETHTGAIAFSPSYLSLPDSASYDVKDNLFNLFYMNTTNQRIDQWSGSGSFWTKTNGIVNTIGVFYPDSISSFIQSSPIAIGSIFYVSRSASPFTLNSASLKFKAASSNATLTVTITSKYGFTGTVNLTTKTLPTTGLTVNCTPTVILGGSGTSTCNLATTLQGNYNVNVTGTSGSLSHSTTIAVTVLAIPDFSISASQPVPVYAGQSTTSTITISAVNGFTGAVTLTDGVPSGLTCGPITPATVTNYGTANVPCNASTVGNYTLTIIGMSGTLSHSTSTTFVVVDFAVSSSPSTIMILVGSSRNSTVTVTGLNHFNGTVSLIPSSSAALTTALSLSSITASGRSTLTVSAFVSGNYTVSVTATSGSLSHTILLTVQAMDFALTGDPGYSIVTVGSTTNTSPTVTSLSGFSGNLTLTVTVLYPIYVPPNVPSSGTHPPIRLAPLPILPTASTNLAWILLGSGGSGRFTITIVASPGVAAAYYPLIVTAGNGTLSHSILITVIVRDFSLTAAPSSVTMTPGTNSTTTLGLRSLDGFFGNATLVFQGASGGVSGSLSASVLYVPFNGVSNAVLTIQASSTTSPGNYTLTIQATSGTLTHTIFITISVHTALTTILSKILGSNPVTSLSVLGLAGLIGILSIRTNVIRSRRTDARRTFHRTHAFTILAVMCHGQTRRSSRRSGQLIVAPSSDQ